MRIVHVHNPNDWYGASRSLTRMTTYFVRDGHDVLVILPPGGQLTDHLRRAGVQCVEFDRLAMIERSNMTATGLADLFRRSILSTADLVKVIKDFGADIVHSNSSTILSGAVAAKRASVPHIWHLRETYVEFKALWPLYRHLMLALSERVICISQAVAAQFGPVIPAKVAVAYNGIDADDIAPLSDECKRQEREGAGLGGGPVFGVVGRVKLFRKGQEVFVRAAMRIAADYPQAQFAVIGSTFPGYESHLAELEALAAPLGDRFVHVPETSDLSRVYGLIDVLVMPSCVPEPFGNVIMEAMTQGLPVLASNGGGAVEQVRDGETGFLTPIADDAALAEAMRRLLDDPALRDRLGRAGRLRVEAEFSLAKAERRITEIFAETVAAAERRSG